MIQKRFTFYSIEKRSHYKFNLKTFLFFLLFNPLLIASYSEIMMFISGNGTQNVINNGFSPIPNEIYVNGRKIVENSRTCNLEGKMNIITIRFNEQIYSCANMFKNLKKIRLIYLSDFDASKVTNMDSMFYSCSNLSFIKFGNINTSSLHHMSNLFQRCTSLTSVNFSNWDTSKVTAMEWIFEGCSNLERVVFGNISTSSLLKLTGLFCNCYNLISVDFRYFNTSHVTDMGYMLSNCSSLKSLDLSNFDTSKIENMDNMFFNCSSLKYLNIENFKLPETVNISSFFGGLPSNSVICVKNNTIKNSLLSLNRISFCSDECYKLNNSKIDISGEICLDSCDKSISNKYEYKNTCFYKCPNNTLLNENKCLNNECKNNPDSTKCSSEGIPLGYYFDLEEQIYKKCYGKCYSCYGKGNETNNNCRECKDNLILLNDSLNITNCFNTCNYYYYFDKENNYHCTESNQCPNEYDILIEEKGQCIYQEELITTYEKAGSTLITEALTIKSNIETISTNKIDIFAECENGFLIDENNNAICKCALEKCLSCSIEALNNSLCSRCNYDFYPIENDPSNIGQYINCYKGPLKGFYLDKNEKIFKKCYYTCETCEIEGNNITHNCLECNEDFHFNISFANNSFNCYENCPYYHYFDSGNNYHCTTNYSCPNNYPLLIKDKLECIKGDIYNMLDDIIILNLNLNFDIKEIIINSTYENIYYNIYTESFENIITSENYDTSRVDIGIVEVLELEKMTISFNTLGYENYDDGDYNLTRIEFGDCEMKLKRYYNLSIYDKIYLEKIETKQEGIQIPKVEYNLYSKLSGQKLTKLNISVCDDSEIFISYSISLTENIDLFNSNSDYYNNVCYKATSDSGTDITLNDRKKEYVDKNKFLCQEDCYLIEYNYTTQRVKCSCEVKEPSSSFVDRVINKTKLIENLGDFKTFSNINILTCHKSLFILGNILYNFGFYIITCIIILHIINCILFFMKKFKLIKETIQDITLGIINYKEKKFNEDAKSDELIIKRNIEKKGKIIYNNLINSSKRGSKRKIRKKKRTRKKGKNKANNNKNLTPIINEIPKININNNNNSIDNYTNTNNIRKIRKTKTFEDIINEQNRNNNYTNLPENIKERVKNIMKFTDDEINKFSYDLAIKYDQRKWYEYYFSLLKTKHNIIFSFFYNGDYNSKIIKIDLFFVGFSIYYAINALFFDDDNMHKIYENKGTFNLEYQLPKTIYSFIISIVLNMLVKLLALSNDGIIKFKQDKNKEDVNDRKKSLEKLLKIKFIVYFIISFIFLLFFWFYISLFGAIYQNTQLHLLTDTLISFGLSLVYPFIINFIPLYSRIQALSEPKMKRKFLYCFSKVLQLF